MDKLNVSLDDVIKNDNQKRRPDHQRGGKSRTNANASPKARSGGKASNLDLPLESMRPTAKRRPSVQSTRGRQAPYRGGRPGAGGRPVAGAFRGRQDTANLATFGRLRDSPELGKRIRRPIGFGIQKQKETRAPRVNTSMNRAQAWNNRQNINLSTAMPSRNTRNVQPQHLTNTNRGGPLLQPTSPSAPGSAGSGFSAKDHDLMKNIKVVAQLDKVPAPLQAQRSAKVQPPSASQQINLPRSTAGMTLNQRFGK